MQQSTVICIPPDTSIMETLMSSLIKGFESLNDIVKVHETSSANFFCKKNGAYRFNYVKFGENDLPLQFTGNLLLFFGQINVKKLSSKEKNSYLIEYGENKPLQFLFFEEFEPMIIFPFFLDKDMEDHNLPMLPKEFNGDDDYHLVNCTKVILKLINEGYEPLYYQVEHGDFDLGIDNLVDEATVEGLEECVVAGMLEYVHENIENIEKANVNIRLRKHFKSIAIDQSGDNSIEESIYVKGFEKPFLYSMSNDLDDIIKATYKRCDYIIDSLSDFKLNENLSIDVKNLMNKNNVKFSMTCGSDYIVINARRGDDWYSVVYNFEED